MFVESAVGAVSFSQTNPDDDGFTTPLARTIFKDKYSKDGLESWADTAHRVVEAVCADLLPSETKNRIEQLIRSRKFIPGGRYLYAAGREFHQVNNCFLFRAEDSREGWADVQYKAAMALMTGGGIGIDYSDIRPAGSIVKRTGGVATGPIALMHAVNEAGRSYVQGGNRRSAIWAGLRWDHKDVRQFLTLKNHSEDLKALKAKDLTFPLPMELTNISVLYDKAFFEAYEQGDRHAQDVWITNAEQAFSTAEPGFSFNFKNARESLRNAPVSADTLILTAAGYVPIREVIDRETTVWTGQQWVETTFRKTKTDVRTVVVRMSNGRTIKADPEHEFRVATYRPGSSSADAVFSVPAGQLREGDFLYVSFPDLYPADRVIVLSVTDGPIEDVYCCDVGVEEHSFCAEGVIISNCTEVVSEDDSDKCNLGTLWISKFSSLQEFGIAVELATAFLLCGGIYSDVPTEKIREVGALNNRIGLGLGGLHEWLMLRGDDYEVTPELHRWLSMYRDISDTAAFSWSRYLFVAEPKGKRAIAPNGTIGIVAETTTGIEPLFCAAYKRRYFKNGKWFYQYTIDGSVKRLISRGVPIEVIERNDAYGLGFEQRVKFQADVQDYVDMSISSTCNMAPWGSESNNSGTVAENAKILYQYGPRLRGFTVYPDGSRGGQPIEKVPFSLAVEQEGAIFREEVRECTNGVCGL